VFYPIGAVFQADLAHHVGVRIVSVLAAAVFLALLAVMTVWRPQWWHDMGVPRSDLEVLVAD